MRHPVLRPGRPVEECHFNGDLLETTFHLGLYVRNNLLGVASFMKAGTSLFQEEFQYQLRGMAVLPDHAGKGYGAALLAEGEKKVKELDPHPLLWFNARHYAVDFYKKYGYKTIGESFDVPGVCEHIVMYRYI